jgi:hypothetical protein
MVVDARQQRHGDQLEHASAQRNRVMSRAVTAGADGEDGLLANDPRAKDLRMPSGDVQSCILPR